MALVNGLQHFWEELLQQAVWMALVVNGLQHFWEKLLQQAIWMKQVMALALTMIPTTETLFFLPSAPFATHNKYVI
jgi:hypothetical protein